MVERPDLCRVCRRRPPAPVCPGCREGLAARLGELPDLARRLAIALVPSPAGGEKVAASREAPLPVRLAALTLVAGGSDQARCVFVPKVHTWSSVMLVGDRVATVWHRQPARDDQGRPVLVLANDQVGVLPVYPWLAKWCYEWRCAFGHSTAPERPVAAREGSGVPQVPDSVPGPPAATTAARTVLGLGPAIWPRADRPADPLADEWLLRWGEPAWSRLPALHHRYLTTWLDHACDNYSAISDFAVSLKALTGALRAALGDFDDLEYIGRCPEEVADRHAGTTSVCGTPIWHDPYVDKIVCPRCRMETDQRRRIWLARRILQAWPIDHRRRYSRGLIDILELPACGTCGETVTVDWIDATERTDAERFWRPGAVTCHVNACEVVFP